MLGCALRRDLRRNTCRACLPAGEPAPGHPRSCYPPPGPQHTVPSPGRGRSNQPFRWALRAAYPLGAFAISGAEPRVTVGGRRRCRGSAPDPARYPGTPGILSRASLRGCPVQRRIIRKFPTFSAESIVLPGGLRVLADGGYGSSPSPPPSTPLARARRGPRSRRPWPARRACPGAQLIHAGQTLRSVTAYGLDPFSNFVSLFGHVSTRPHRLKPAIPAFVWTKQTFSTSAVKECSGARACGEVA